MLDVPFLHLLECHDAIRELESTLDDCGGTLHPLPAHVGQVLREQDIALGHDHSVPEHILQLADIPGKIETLQFFQRVGIDASNRAPLLAVDLVDEEFGEARDVVEPFAERRHFDHHHGEAVVEVLPEFALLHQLIELLVCGGDHAGVEGDAPVAPHPRKFPFLEHAEQFRLHLQWHVADLIEENGAVRGEFQFSHRGGNSSGERPFFMPEKLRFDQPLGDRRTVNRNKGFFPLLTVVMDRLGDQLLACARLAGDQHAHPAGGHLADGFENLLHRRGAADKVVHPVLRADFLDHPGEVALLMHRLQRSVDHQFQLVRVDGFADVLESAELHRPNRGFHVLICGDHDHRQIGALLFHLFQQRDAVEVRHPDVRYHQVGLLLLERLQSFLPVMRDPPVVPVLADVEDNRFGKFCVIVNQQNDRHLRSLPSGRYDSQR